MVVQMLFRCLIAAAVILLAIGVSGCEYVVGPYCTEPQTGMYWDLVAEDSVEYTSQICYEGDPGTR